MYHSASEKGNVEIVSDATGEVVKVNLRSAFQAHNDLKKFLPTKFQTSGDFGDIRIDNDLGGYNSKKAVGLELRLRQTDCMEK